MKSNDDLKRQVAKLREDYQRKSDELAEHHQGRTQHTDWRHDLHKEYIRDILPKVIELMRHQKSAGSVQVEKADLLVLGLGMTFEPLLISIAYWQPRRILLVRNRDYGLDGQTVSEQFRQQVKWLRETVDLDEPGRLFHQDCVLQNDEPAQVFADLRSLDRGVPGAMSKIQNDLSTEKPRVVLDITGGKKSMVSGAFLFAAYMPGIQIAYVDFTEYDPIRNRPLDETCFIRVLENPYEVFRLRDWEQVQRAYESYRFDDTLRGLNLIAQAARDSLSKVSEENRCIPILQSVLETYHAWNSGNLRKAKALHNKLPDQIKGRMPTAVEVLHGDWPDEMELRVKDSTGLRRKTEKAAPYAQDELAKLARIVRFSDDYRSAFVRAYGVYDLLLDVRRAVAKEKSEDKDTQARGILTKIGFTSAFDPSEFRATRDNLTHVHHSVPKHFAEEALNIANANFADFCNNWLGSNGFTAIKAQLDQMQCDAIPWNELLGLVGLNSLKRIDFTPDEGGNP